MEIVPSGDDGSDSQSHMTEGSKGESQQTDEDMPDDITGQQTTQNMEEESATHTTQGAKTERKKITRNNKKRVTAHNIENLSLIHI